MRISRVACVVIVASLSVPICAESASLDPLVKVLARVDDPVIQRDVLKGMHAALSDRRSVPMPAGWHAVYEKLDRSSDPVVRQESTILSLLFGDPQAVQAMHALLADSHADVSQRQAALESLAQTHDPQLVPLLHGLLDDRAMAGAALRALAGYADEGAPGVIFNHYKSLSDADKRDAILTLSSRPAWALALLDAIKQGAVPKQDLTAFNVRQIANLNDRHVGEALKSVWGPIRGTSQDKLALLDQYKKKFTHDVLAKANLPHGRAIFASTCGVCHTLFDAGGQVGPNLTGSQRANLDYVLGKVLDPSAVVSPNYRMTVIKTKDGRVINGIVYQETDAAVTLKAPNETIVVQKADIEKRKLSDLSMMPEGLLSAMTDPDARDLLAYLASPSQVAPQSSSAVAK
jgi:putative heme-binding domain-containing protein